MNQKDEELQNIKYALNQREEEFQKTKSILNQKDEELQEAKHALSQKEKELRNTENAKDYILSRLEEEKNRIKVLNIENIEDSERYLKKLETRISEYSATVDNLKSNIDRLTPEWNELLQNVSKIREAEKNADLRIAAEKRALKLVHKSLYNRIKGF